MLIVHKSQNFQPWLPATEKHYLTSMKTTLLLTALAATLQLSAQNYTSFLTGNATDLIANPTGGICLMGGATESDQAMQWFLQRANGGDILVLRASGADGYNDYFYTDLGITVNSVETIRFNAASAASEAYIQDKIQKAEAIWFAGGDQWNYVSYWRNNAIDSLINDAIENRNIVIGGTSAGMAILGQVYFSAENGSVTSAEALNDPYNTYMTVDSTDFLHNDWLQEVITDTHYDDPDRKGRHVAFLARMTQDYGMDAKGIACDEYTAVCISPEGIARVYGDYPSNDDNAYFIQRNCAVAGNLPEVCTAGSPLSWDRNDLALVACQLKGTTTGANTFDLNDWRTTTGGTWHFWSVNNGTLLETAGAQPDCGLGLEEKTMAVSLFPNPATESFEVVSDVPVKQLIVRNALGETVITTKKTIVSVAAIPAGIYFVECVTPNGSITVRLIRN